MKKIKLKKLLKKIKKGGYRLSKPANVSDIEKLKDYFVPDDYKEFLSITDGINDFDIYSVSEVLEENSGKVKQDELDCYEMDYKGEDWVFFARDGMGGYYAFKNSEGENAVYYFDHEFPEELEERGNFTEWLLEHFEMFEEIKDMD